MPADGDCRVEGRARGVSHAQLHDLRAGKMTPVRKVDLHGLTRREAVREVTRVIAEQAARSASAGPRLVCVLIVTGRGKRSPEGPVLRPAIIDCLASAELSRWVRGFCTARTTDGGTGALYVMVKTR